MINRLFTIAIYGACAGVLVNILTGNYAPAKQYNSPPVVKTVKANP